MKLLLWATGFLSFALYLGLQELLDIGAAFSALLVGLLLLVIALLASGRLEKKEL